MSARARTHTSLLGLAILALVLPLWWSAHNAEASTDTDPSAGGGGGTPSFVVPSNFKVKLIRAGLDTQALAAAGVPSQGIHAVLQAAADHMNANPSAISGADATFAAAQVSADTLRRKVQSGLATPEEVSACQSAIAALASATSARQAALDATFNAATAGLSSEVRARLAMIRSNRSWGLPLELLTVERTEAQWVALRDALSNERIAAELSEEPDGAAQALLTAARSNGTVSAAKAALDTNLASVTTSWNTAAGQ